MTPPERPVAARPHVSALTPAAAAAPAACAGCGTELAPGLASCPSCGTPVYASALQRLAASAEAAEARGDAAAALGDWRSALELLPPGSEQRAAIAARAARLTRAAAPRPSGAATAEPATGDTPKSALARSWKAIAAAGLFLLSKIKLLLLGLTKLKTFVSMLAFLGVYWQLWGWPFALGFVVCIYVHEMGHVAALARYGIPADAPMFIPGLGAFVRLRQLPETTAQDARVGLAGPVWGLAAGLAAYAVYVATGLPIWGAIAQSAGWLNLFNLLPVWQLDGGRGFRALSRAQRWMAVAALVATWTVVGQPLLLIIGAVAVWQAFRTAPDEADPPVLVLYAGLILACGWLSALHIPGLPPR